MIRFRIRPRLMAMSTSNRTQSEPLEFLDTRTIIQVHCDSAVRISAGHEAPLGTSSGAYHVRTPSFLRGPTSWA